MTRHRKLLPILALLSLSATSLAPPFTKAQAQEDLLSQQEAEPPRSILPPPRASRAPVSNAPMGGGAEDPRGSSDSPSYGQPYSPPASENPPAPANVMTSSDASPPPPPSQPYSPPPSEDPPASASVMTSDASPPPPPSQTWGPPPEEGAYSSSGILDAARSFFGSASEGLAKVVESSFQREGQPYSPPPSENPPASANVMTPDVSPPPPPSQTRSPVAENSVQRNGHASLGEPKPVNLSPDAIKALEAYMYLSDSGSVSTPRKTRGDDVH